MVLATSIPLLTDPPSRQRLKEAEYESAGANWDHQSQKMLPSTKPTISEVPEEIKQLYTVAFPMIMTGLLVYGKSIISMVFMGSLGKDALAGGSLSIGIANITGYSVISGLALGMEPIASQACGAKQWHLMTQTLQRTILILLSASIPVSILWLNIEKVLVFCGQDPKISSIASVYLTYCLPDLLFHCLIHPLKIYLRSQNITFPLILSAASALVFHAPVNYLLVHHLGLGIAGTAVSVAVTDFCLLTTLLLFTCYSGSDRKSLERWSWQGWHSSMFRGWKQILSFAIPCCVSVCLEWWWYELMILLSGVLPNAAEAVATMGILIQVTSLVYVFPSSLSMAASTRVGNELGANEPGRAKLSSLVAMGCAIVTGLIAMSFMTMFRNAWGHAFTRDGAILSLTAAAMPVVAVCELGNGPQTTGCGVLRGSGRPSLGAKINLGSFYGVGLPFAIFMGFSLKMGLVGLWLGMLVAQLLCALVMGLMLKRTDWEVEASKARELIGVEEGSEVEGEKDVPPILIKAVS